MKPVRRQGRLTTVQHRGQNHQRRARTSSSIRMSRAMARMVPSDWGGRGRREGGKGERETERDVVERGRGKERERKEGEREGETREMGWGGREEGEREEGEIEGETEREMGWRGLRGREKGERERGEGETERKTEMFIFRVCCGYQAWP